MLIQSYSVINDIIIIVMYKASKHKNGYKGKQQLYTDNINILYLSVLGWLL